MFFKKHGTGLGNFPILDSQQKYPFFFFFTIIKADKSILKDNVK